VAVVAEVIVTAVTTADRSGGETMGLVAQCRPDPHLPSDADRLSGADRPSGAGRPSGADHQKHATTDEVAMTVDGRTSVAERLPRGTNGNRTIGGGHPQSGAMINVATENETVRETVARVRRVRQGTAAVVPQARALHRPGVALPTLTLLDVVSLTQEAEYIFNVFSLKKIGMETSARVQRRSYVV
jgi:hypothetical protein